jgi:hypothetical protein
MDAERRTGTELEQMAPEMDDEDIGTVLQLVAEMSETEEMAEDQIGNELAQLG